LEGGPNGGNSPRFRTPHGPRAMDAAARPEPRIWDFFEWRASSPIRPIVFDPPPHIDEGWFLSTRTPRRGRLPPSPDRASSTTTSPRLRRPDRRRHPPGRALGVFLSTARRIPLHDDIINGYQRAGSIFPLPARARLFLTPKTLRADTRRAGEGIRVRPRPPRGRSRGTNAAIGAPLDVATCFRHLQAPRRGSFASAKEASGDRAPGGGCGCAGSLKTSVGPLSPERGGEQNEAQFTFGFRQMALRRWKMNAKTDKRSRQSAGEWTKEPAES